MFCLNQFESSSKFQKKILFNYDNVLEFIEL
jgi:hypothetical protein